MKDFIISFTGTVLVIFLIGAVIYTILEYTNLPEVYRSYSTNKCTKIKYEGKNIPCTDLKSYPKYIIIWVE